METEKPKLIFLKNPLSHQIEIGHIVLTGASPGAINVQPMTGHQRHFTAIRFIGGAKIEAPEASAKNIAQDAVARRFPVAMRPRPESGAFTFSASYA